MDKDDLMFYGNYADTLLEKQNMILMEMDRILEKMTKESNYAPAEHIRSRIKSATSLREKLDKNGLPETVYAGLTSLSDIIGVRVVTHFIGDIYGILEWVKESDCWEVVRIKDYIAAPKPNGYRSLHVILKLPAVCSNLDFIMAEIQLRTIAMDCWASLEHELKYKKNVENADLIGNELKRCADEIASTDLSMQTIREIIQAQ